MPISALPTPTFGWSGCAFLIAGAFCLRWIRHRWVFASDVLDALIVFAWACLVLARLNLYFIRELELPFGIHWLRWIIASTFWATPILFLPRSWRRWFGVFLVGGAVIVVTKDVAYFRIFGLLWSPNFWSLFSPWRMVSSAFLQVSGIHSNSMAWLLAEAFIVSFVLPLLPKNSLRICWQIPQRVRWGIVISLIGIMSARLFWGYQHLYREPIESSEAGDIHQWGLWDQHFFHLLMDLNEYRNGGIRPIIQNENLKDVKENISGARHIGTSHFGVARRYNLILIQAESLQEFVLGSQIMGQEVTPFLNSLHKRGGHFEQVFSQVNSNWDIDAQFITLNSLHVPLPAGSIFLWKRHELLNALPQVLSQYGYYTFAAHPSTGWTANQLSMYKRYGFQSSQFLEDMGRVRPEEKGSIGMADEVFLERMMPVLKQMPQPFFAYLLTLGADRHLRRSLPEHLRYLHLGPIENTPLGRYLQEMSELDFALKEFLGSIEHSDLQNNTVIAVSGSRAHLPMNFEVQTFLGVQQGDPLAHFSLSRVPFFVLIPHSVLKGEIRTPGGQVDIAPTLLGLLGVKQPSSYIGSSLLDSPPPVVAFQDGSVFSKDRAFIPQPPDSDSSGCFDPPTGSSVTLANCDGVRALANRQLEISDLIHQENSAVDLQMTTKAGRK